MATKLSPKDPRMVNITAGLTKLGDVDMGVRNLIERTKVALGDSKDIDAKLAKAGITDIDAKTLTPALKSTLAMGKLSAEAAGAIARIFKDSHNIKDSNGFEDFSKKLKTNMEPISKLASAAKQFIVAINNEDELNALKKVSAHYAAIKTYAEQTLSSYMAFAKSYNVMDKLKNGEMALPKEPNVSIDALTDYVRLAFSLEGYCKVFQKSGKTAAAELKKARKANKDKKLDVEYGNVGATIEHLTGAAEKAVSAFAGMLKDLQKAQKGGPVDDCIQELRKKSSAFLSVQLDLDEMDRRLKNASFDHQNASSFSGLKGVNGYARNYGSDYKTFAAAKL